MERRCSNCGTKYDEEAQFCPNCGAGKLSEKTAFNLFMTSAIVTYLYFPGSCILVFGGGVTFFAWSHWVGGIVFLGGLAICGGYLAWALPVTFGGGRDSKP
jgi:hypothetical protein